MPPPARDWIFIVDGCGDRTPRLARAQIEIVRNLMDFAEEGDTAALIVAGVRPRTLARYRLDATPETTARMVEMLEQTHLVGGLNLQRAIEAARPFLAAAGNPVLVFIGADRASLGQRDPKALLAKIPASVRILAIGATAGEWPELVAVAATRPGGLAATIDPEVDFRRPIVELLDAMDQSAARIGWHVPELAKGVVSPFPRPSPTMGTWCPQGRATPSFVRACAGLLPQIPRPRFVASDLGTWKEIVLAGWQWHAGRLAEADERFRRLLADPEAARCPLVWRLAARLADERGRFGRAITCWEKALELEAAKGSGGPCAADVRRDYAWLLDEYRKLVLATAGLPSVSSHDLVVRVVAAADRWRLLDPDPTPACYAAARLLADLGATEEAWEYVTTPPDWKKLAERLERDGYGGIMKSE